MSKSNDSVKLLHETGVELTVQSEKSAWSTFNLGRKVFCNSQVFAYDKFMAGLLSVLTKPCQVVCEYGCGDGIWLEYLAQLFPEKTFIGVEWNRRLWKYARQKRLKKLKNATVFKKDASKVSVECDFFFALGVVEHFGDSAEVLKSWVEHLTPKGAAVVTVPNLLNWDRAVKRHGLKLEDLKGRDIAVAKTYGFEQLMSPNTFISLVIDAGLEFALFRWMQELPAERSLLAVAFKRDDK